MISFPLPDGALHQAVLMMPESDINLLVLEDKDGTLSLLEASAVDDSQAEARHRRMQARTEYYNHLLACEKQINRAFVSLGKIVSKNTEYSQAYKSFLLRQIRHVTQHLAEYVYSFHQDR